MKVVSGMEKLWTYWLISKSNRHVVVFTGIELIVFIDAFVELCFRIWMKIVTIAHGCFSCCRAVFTPSQGPSSSLCCPASEGAEGAPGAGGDPAGPGCPKGWDIPHYLASSSAVTAGAKKE